MNIPKTIVQTWISEDKLTPVMKAATQTWKDKNPGWDYKFFSDEDCLEFIENNFAKDTVNAYNKIKPGAGKADLFRYCYLLVKGGVYTDIDNICVKPLDDWLTDVDKFVGVLDLGSVKRTKYQDESTKVSMVSVSRLAIFPQLIHGM